MLRDYQQAALDAAVDYVKTCKDAGLIEAATGAGKSHIIAELAHWLNKTVGKKVLCLAPSKELVAQNHKKYLATGNPASVYSASISKSLAHDVVFGSPLTVKNEIDKFNNLFSLVIVDEAHNITESIKSIIDSMRKKNPLLRVIGLTATPYRMNTGYIYQIDEKGDLLTEDKAYQPYFKKLIFKITAQELIERGFLTRPHSEDVTTQYDTSAIVKHTEKEYRAVFNDKERLTAEIVRDVVQRSYGRRGVMFFAATIQHANEIMQSLNPEHSRIVTGKTKKAEREQILNDFLLMRFKYLVNVAVLTTGFDAPHVDVIAILRATESASLFQQIIGRGLRLFEGKSDCLVLDYAGNVDRHCPSGDLFEPEIKAKFKESGGVGIDAICPTCSATNEFTGRPNPDQYAISEKGYFVDLRGNEILNADDKPIPAHFGRRCLSAMLIAGSYERCNYRWSLKECPECQHENDIAARYCEKCKAEIVDPNEKLAIEFTRIKKDPYSESTDQVFSWLIGEHYTPKGDQTLKVTYTTKYRTFNVWYRTDKAYLYSQWQSLCLAVFGSTVADIDTFISGVNRMNGAMPHTITSYKDRKTQFFKITAHNRAQDEI